MIRGVQLARILLSSSVFFWHFYSVLSKAGIFERNQMLLSLFKGEEAVICFFLLSGFLFGYKDIDVSWIVFVKKRFLKIAPLYYSSVAIGLPLLFLFYKVMGLDAENLKWIILGYLVFMPELVKAFFPQIYGFLDILWSLGVEMLLYSIFPFLSVVKKDWKVVSLIGVFLFVESWLNLADFYIIIWPGVLGFYLGQFKKQRAVRRNLNFDWLLLSLFIPDISTGLLVGIYSFYLLISPLDKIERNSIINIVGVSSFAFYVIHVYFIYAIGMILLHYDICLSVMVAALGSLILYVFIQWISYIVEYKYIKWLNRYIR